MFRMLLENDIACLKYWYPFVSNQPVYKYEKTFSLEKELRIINL